MGRVQKISRLSWVSIVKRMLCLRLSNASLYASENKAVADSRHPSPSAVFWRTQPNAVIVWHSAGTTTWRTLLNITSCLFRPRSFRVMRVNRQTNRQTNRHTYHNILHPFWWWSNESWQSHVWWSVTAWGFMVAWGKHSCCHSLSLGCGCDHPDCRSCL